MVLRFVNSYCQKNPKGSKPDGTIREDAVGVNALQLDNQNVEEKGVEEPRWGRQGWKHALAPIR